MRWLDGITDAMDMNLGKFWEMVRERETFSCCSPCGHKESDTPGRLNIILCTLLPPTTHCVQSSFFIFLPHGSKGKRR